MNQSNKQRNRVASCDKNCACSAAIVNSGQGHAVGGHCTGSINTGKDMAQLNGGKSQAKYDSEKWVLSQRLNSIFSGQTVQSRALCARQKAKCPIKGTVQKAESNMLKGRHCAPGRTQNVRSRKCVKPESKSSMQQAKCSARALCSQGHSAVKDTVQSRTQCNQGHKAESKMLSQETLCKQGYKAERKMLNQETLCNQGHKAESKMLSKEHCAKQYTR